MTMRQSTPDSTALRPQWYDVRRSLDRVFLQRPAARYGAALAVVSLMTALVLAVPAQLELETLQLLYIVGVLATAVVSGFGPALLAATLSFGCINFFFVSPHYTFRVARPEEVLRLLEFWVAALLSGSLAAYARHQTERAQRRVLEIATLHTLTQVIDTEATLQGRLDQIVATTATLLAIPYCAVTLQAPACAAAWGERAQVAHWLDLPMTQGETMIGRLQAGLPRNRQFAADDYHVLRLITSQLIFVLERARMLDAAAQARTLAESDRLKSAILSSLSHDLRTPLTTIQGAVSELKATDVDWTAATRAQLLDAIDDQTQRLRRVVGNLLDLSKLRAGALLPHTDWYALDEIIYHALDSLKQQLDDHLLTVHIPPDLPLTRLDFVLTEQVVTNLVQNAVQYGRPGTPVTITVTADADHLACRIANQGLPLPPAWHARIFEPFVRYHGAETSVAGSGLGLAICQGFVEAQGGTIALDSTLDDGVAIVFTIPRQTAGSYAND